MEKCGTIRYMRTCPICGRTFLARRNRIYCSTRCRVAAHRFFKPLNEEAWFEREERAKEADAAFDDAEREADRHTNSAERIAWHRLVEAGVLEVELQDPRAWSDDQRRRFSAEVRAVRARRGG
jgi:hypothetical protein